MSEYMGDTHGVALQKAIRLRADEIAANPLLANGGRILNIVDPETYGWDNVRKDADRDGLVCLTVVERDATLSRLAAMFEDDIDLPHWDVFTGQPDEVVSACRAIRSDMVLPDGWAKSSQTHPDEASIHDAQVLNTASSISPPPAYYLRGDHLPSMLTCLRDQDSNLVACASGTMRYHPDSRLAGWIFAGAVSVSDDRRGKGLGSYVNACLLEDSQTALSWGTALEQAKRDNAASRGMILRCGLRRQPGKATIVVNISGHYVTR